MLVISGIFLFTFRDIGYLGNLIEVIFSNLSSIGAGLASMTSRRQIQDGGPHDFRSKMAASMTSGPRWRPP